RGLRFDLLPSPGVRVDVDVFQQSVGRRVVPGHVVARFRGRSRSFTWDGVANRGDQRVRDGYLFVRYRVRTGSPVRFDRIDLRRVALRRDDRRFRIRPRFDRGERCAPIAAFKMLRPAFGGRGDSANYASYRLGSAGRVTLEILDDGEVVRRYRQGARAAGPLYRVRVAPRGLPRGNLVLRLRVDRGNGAVNVARLVSRRL
ncbi:MAG TPA: hypothetical protein VGR12_05230, partial [Solirubrobacteraceae bacterium]|nr:hypothetical protein [Solirubrobacteraceae bacterium]